MRSFLKIIFPVIIFIHSCKDCPQSKVADVNKVIFNLIEADNNADIETVLSSYTDSIEFYPVGKSFLKGKTIIRVSYEKLFSENKVSLNSQILETK